MKTRRDLVQPFPGGAHIFHRMFTRLGCAGRPPHFVTEFFPYANLTHTIRLRDETAYVRFSDVVRGAPLSVLEGVAAILLGRVYRRRVPAELTAVYRQFALADGTRRRVTRVRRLRARRAATNPDRGHRKLARLFTRLNMRYFSNRLPRPHLAWSVRPWRSQFGCYDSSLNQIVMNCRLDHDRVPACALEYVLFHEMLHIKHPVRRAACGLQSHSAEFRSEEKRFADYQRARRWLMRLA
jgi:hypothetical protein